MAGRDVSRHGSRCRGRGGGPGGFADQVGLQPGDILLQLGAGAVFGNREVMFFVREHDVGDEVEAVWAHDGIVPPRRGPPHDADLEVFAAQRMSYSGKRTSTTSSRTWTG